MSLRISLLFIALFLSACSDRRQKERLPYYNTPDFSPVFLESKDDVEERIKHTIQPFSFTDQFGKRISDNDVAGKIHVANFIFTNCISICPVMTKHMKLLQNEFSGNKKVAMLSFSVTPWIDSVGRLNAYARENGIHASNWHLLTGSKGKIYDLARKSYFAEEDLGFAKDSSEFLHTEHIILVDKSKRIRGIYNGTLQLEAEQLMADIKQLIKEESL